MRYPGLQHTIDITATRLHAFKASKLTRSSCQCFGSTVRPVNIQNIHQREGSALLTIRTRIAQDRLYKIFVPGSLRQGALGVFASSSYFDGVCAGFNATLQPQNIKMFGSDCLATPSNNQCLPPLLTTSSVTYRTPCVPAAI